jgi:hypothetical protein
MSNLKTTIEGLANDFAKSIIAALRSASIDELTGISGAARTTAAAGRPARAPAAVAETAAAPRKRGRGGRLGRRSSDEITNMIEQIVGLLQKHPEGLRAEQIREALGVQAKELPRPLADGLKEGRLSKAGQKRATTYFSGGSGGGRGRGRRRG